MQTRTFMERIRQPGVMLGVLALAASAAVAACSPTGSSDTDQTPVPLGASQQEYIDALADMDPVELTVQLPTGPETFHSRTTTAYTDAVEEWSGGKITFEVLFSGSRVDATQVRSAMADGLVDIGPINPFFEPELFPVTAEAARLTFLQNSTPLVGSMQFAAAWLDFGYDVEAITEELLAEGITPLIPLLGPGGTPLMCADSRVTSLSDFAGTSIRVSTPAHQDAIEELGATGVNIPTLEVYEGLQRGVADCIVSPFALAGPVGLAEVTSHWTVDPEVQFSGSIDSFAISTQVWESLPLAAQQLLWDRLDVYIEAYISENSIGSTADALNQAADEGVEIHAWDADVITALRDYGEDVLERVRSDAPDAVDGDAFVQAAQDRHDEWREIITQDLGYEDSVEWADFAAWVESNEIDYEPLIERIREEILNPRRPGELN